MASGQELKVPDVFGETPALLLQLNLSQLHPDESTANHEEAKSKTGPPMTRRAGWNPLTP